MKDIDKLYSEEAGPCCGHQAGSSTFGCLYGDMKPVTSVTNNIQ